MSIQSWDLFDTLIARKCIEATGIFDIVEKKSGFVDFKKIRHAASKKKYTATWQDIYDEFQNVTKCSVETRQMLEKLEIETEKNQLFLISETTTQVKDGDIIVSDMYFSKEILQEFLEHLHFPRQVTIYVSPIGKATGQIWFNGTIPSDIVSNIKHHTGDNKWSDVTTGRLKGIVTRHYSGASLIKSEKLVRENGFETLAQCLRATRLSNPFVNQRAQLWNQQVELNLPLLYLASIQLGQYVEENKLDTILFASRDCALWHHVFSAMYPNRFKVHYIEASRKLMLSPTPQYIQYMTELTKGGRFVFVDLQASGTSTKSFFKNHMGNDSVFIFIMLLQKWLTKMMVGEAVHIGFSAANVNIKECGDKVEKLNYDIVGTLKDYTASGPIRSEPEYDIELVKPYHAAARVFVKFLSGYPSEKFIADSTVSRLINSYLAQIETSQVLESVKHIGVHDASVYLSYAKNSPYASWVLTLAVVIVLVVFFVLVVKLILLKD